MARTKAARKKGGAKAKTAASAERLDATAGSDFGALGMKGREDKGDSIALEETVQAGVKRLRVRSQSMLDRYLLRGQISRRQFDAGERLHRAWRTSGSAPLVVANYGPRIKGGNEMSERQALARSDVTAALLAVGTRQASVLIHVCLCDEAAGDWGDRYRGKASDGIPILRLALDSLADHWGMPA